MFYERLIEGEIGTVKTQVRPGGRPNGASILSFLGSSSAHWSGRLPRWCGEKRRQGGAYPGLKAATVLSRKGG
jgi:hypothetical protein